MPENLARRPDRPRRVGCALTDDRQNDSYLRCRLHTSVEAKQSDNASRKAMIKGRIDSGVPIGILAYKHGTPVGWCSIAPRATCRPQMADHQPGASQHDPQTCSFVQAHCPLNRPKPALPGHRAQDRRGPKGSLWSTRGSSVGTGHCASSLRSRAQCATAVAWFRRQGRARGRRAAPGPAGSGAVRPATRDARGSSSPHRAPRCRR